MDQWNEKTGEIGWYKTQKQEKKSIKKIIVHWMPADIPSKASCVEGTTKAALGRPRREQIRRTIQESAVMLENQQRRDFWVRWGRMRTWFLTIKRSDDFYMNARLQWPSLHNLKLWPQDFFIAGGDGHVVQLKGEKLHRANITGGGDGLTWVWSQHLWPGGWIWRPPGDWCRPSPACRRRRLQAWFRHCWRPERRCWWDICGTGTGVSCWTDPRCWQSRLSHLVEAEAQGQRVRDLGHGTPEIWIYNNGVPLVQYW